MASGLARELDLLRRDEAETRRATAVAAIQAAYAKFQAETAVIRAAYQRDKDEADRRAAALKRGA